MPGIEKLYTPNSIYTYSGQLVNVIDMAPEQIMPEDIAYGLARECRFGNHTKKFYSVAEHSIECMLMGQAMYPLDKPLHFRLLMHDAHEAYLGDWVTPLVDAMEGLYPGLKNSLDVVKKIVQSKINTRFGISLCPLKCFKVKEIDRKILEWEWESKVTAWKGMNPLPDKETAELWLHYFKELVKVPAFISESAV